MKSRSKTHSKICIEKNNLTSISFFECVENFIWLFRLESFDNVRKNLNRVEGSNVKLLGPLIGIQFVSTLSIEVN